MAGKRQGNRCTTIARASLRQPRTFVLRIPRLPPSVLSSNARVHWGERSRVAKTERELAAYTAIAAMALRGEVQPMEHARISYTFLARDKRKRDWDNLLTACKPWQDSLIDAGIIQFDDTDHLEIGSMKFSRGKVVQTIITVEEVM